jgi:leader peptidase (prepilin peptidase)/N-methyltransferase
MTPDVLFYVFAFIIGSVVGSFLNVCIHRMPRNLSIINPSSRCPSCNTPINPLDNIPVVSFLYLRGKCRTCSAKISPRYPLVEFLNGMLYVLILWKFGIGWHIPFYFALCSSLIVITFIDLDFQIIPDMITLPGIVIGIIAGSLLLPDPFLRYSLLGYKASLIGFLTGGILFYVIAVISRGGMGGGDIKMMAMVGSFMGWKAVLLTTFIGSLSGTLVGVFLMIFKGKGRKSKVPFGPFLSLGTLVTLFYGEEILKLYLYR